MSDQVGHWTIVTTLELAGPDAGAEARDALRRELDGDVDDDLLTDLMLGASEVITNAAAFAPPPYFLTVCRDTSSQTHRVGVCDANRNPLPRHQLPNTGLGLPIVQAVASSWGITPTIDGKEVWFEIHRSAPD